MTRTEHLERIKNMCLLCLENCKDHGYKDKLIKAVQALKQTGKAEWLNNL